MDTRDSRWFADDLCKCDAHERLYLDVFDNLADHQVYKNACLADALVSNVICYNYRYINNIGWHFGYAVPAKCFN